MSCFLHPRRVAPVLALALLLLPAVGAAQVIDDFEQGNFNLVNVDNEVTTVCCATPPTASCSSARQSRGRAEERDPSPSARGLHLGRDLSRVVSVQKPKVTHG
jgi:hypothetical protein